MRLVCLLPLALLVLAATAANTKKKKRVKSAESEPLCCRCVKESVGCNPKSIKPPATAPTTPAPDPTITTAPTKPTIKPKARKPPVEPGFSCPEKIECQIFKSEKECETVACSLNGTEVLNEADIVDLRQTEEDCNFQEILCCDHVDGSLLAPKMRAASTDGDLEERANRVSFRALCEGDDVAATENFKVNRVCGKRDSRAYKDANLPPSFTNPGEWPWVVLLYGGKGYIGAGTLVSKDTVVTVAHKVRNVSANELTVRLGDWNPNKKDEKELFPAVEMKVECIQIHPKANLENLENNLAVLRLSLKSDSPRSILSVVTLYSSDRCLGDEERAERRKAADAEEEEEEDNDQSEIIVRSAEDGSDTATPSYINNVCLPESSQFKDYTERCWVAAWGISLERQREVDLPLVPYKECESKLKLKFEEERVRDWKLKPSELCAGGEPGKDACLGEGGAPLVCLDKARNQFFALGLVSYGFGCNSTLPGVYTNLQDPIVRDFITKAMDNSNLCASG